MTHPLTERQADQLQVEALRAINLEAANAAGPAVLIDADSQDLGAALSELEGEICREVES